MPSGVLATPEYVRIMEQCWSRSPEERPTFKEILHRLKSINPRQVVAFT